MRTGMRSRCHRNARAPRGTRLSRPLPWCLPGSRNRPSRIGHVMRPMIPGSAADTQLTGTSELLQESFENWSSWVRSADKPAPSPWARPAASGANLLGHRGGRLGLGLVAGRVVRHLNPPVALARRAPAPDDCLDSRSRAPFIQSSGSQSHARLHSRSLAGPPIGPGSCQTPWTTSLDPVTPPRVPDDDVSHRRAGAAHRPGSAESSRPKTPAPPWPSRRFPFAAAGSEEPALIPRRSSGPPLSG